MYPFPMIISNVMGIPSDSLSIARGMSISHSYNNNFNLILGIGMHLFTSTIAGIIFGFAIKIINKFKITTFRKGIKRRDYLGNNNILDIIYSYNHDHCKTQYIGDYTSR